MQETTPIRIKTISELHALRGLPKPLHPLISVINLETIEKTEAQTQGTVVLDFYSISIKRGLNIKYKYGQQQYDFDEGVMFFTAPGQVIGMEVGDEPIKHTGWTLFIHPDFLWNTNLAKGIKKYEFFDYAVSEALFLSEREEQMVKLILQDMEREYDANIDRFSQNIIISQIELLLNYSERFYNRQFITRKKAHHQILDKLEQLLDEYFTDDSRIQTGLPTVQEVADALNLSPTYLGGLLKALTGLSTQQHIHEKLIEKAKEKLSTTRLSVSEIAYALGFEHPQSFSKLFKSKTNQSPLEFRENFN
ncbi:helix-turn-helix transcriptional regulator [Xanthocytophaga agilis]|uniref:Helix-turn-helix transcriptional regulator n=1 Tax=Xanthocytophaga agilis TaxID=3048010 RepID=A0AAE3R150_9BACT|nr:helix-turn-helix transcriptional regulator [Xanthocytophaga agilis]MDJ1501809.1 helix-turn-helix transcriptional regulator [Xanthocytophaga agilis]